MTVHDPKDPRHKRIFELLRTQNVSINRAMMASNIRLRPLEGAEIEAVKAAAIRSFKRTDKPDS
jgi:hypothetical protein